MEFTVIQIAAMLGGQVEGDGERKVNQLAKIEEGTAGTISFLANPKYESHIYTTEASAVIVDKTFEAKLPVKTTLIRVENAYEGFTKLLEQYQQIKRNTLSGIEQPCFIGQNPTFGENLYIAAFVYIGNNVTIGNDTKIHAQAYIGDSVEIGRNVTIHSGVKIYANTIIGDNCTFFANAVIGSDGFGFAPTADGSYRTIPQLGNVVIENDVSVGANTTIDCATMGSTILREGVKLDNLVQIAHNVEVGKHTVIAAQTAVAGSTKIGEYCIIAGQVGIGGHITVPNRTKVAGQSGVNKNWKKEGLELGGTLAVKHKDNLRSMAVYQRLPELEKRLIELEKKNAER